MKTIKDIDLQNKAVFLRCEFNVSLGEHVSKDRRLLASLPSINWLCGNSARTVICSHLGRPRGGRDSSLSLQRLVAPLSEALRRPVAFVDDCIGPKRMQLQRALKPTEILLLENVRYYAEENNNDPGFAKALAEEVDVYVNDAFGTCHREHASIVGVPQYVKERAAGLLVDEEVRVITSFLGKRIQPAVGIVGGAKVAGKEGKIHVLQNLIGKMDVLFIVGQLAYYFLKAEGIEVGRTLSADPRQIDEPSSELNQTLADCRSFLENARKVGTRIVLPLDCKASTGDAKTVALEFAKDMFPHDAVAFDIGPKSIDQMRQTIQSANSIVWNGPAGFVEDERYRVGTFSVARAVADSEAQVLIGGGDTVAALADLGVNPARIHICTGGGAMLSMLMGRPLPGIYAIEH